MESDLRNYISKEEFFLICEENGFKSEEDKLQLSGYLHDLGICLHFQDDKDSLLYRTVILKPTWATDAVYKVLDNSDVIANRGVFTRQDLRNIWSGDEYRDKQTELLELMKKFQLCYEIPQQKNHFIAPQLLNDNQPEYDWDASKNLIMRYRYPDFMIKGILTRFIVVMHEDIYSCDVKETSDRDLQQCVWKSGVVLQKNNTKAEVIENYGKREIVVRVGGETPRDLLTIVSNEIDKINKSYKRLKYQKLIPCNCPVCKDSPNPHGYDYKKLMEKYSNGKKTVECDIKPYHTVEILSLIDHSFSRNVDRSSKKLNETIDGVASEKYSIHHHYGDGDNVGGNKNIN